MYLLDKNDNVIKLLLYRNHLYPWVKIRDRPGILEANFRKPNSLIHATVGVLAAKEETRDDPYTWVE